MFKSAENCKQTLLLYFKQMCSSMWNKRANMYKKCQVISLQATEYNAIEQQIQYNLHHN